MIQKATFGASGVLSMSCVPSSNPSLITVLLKRLTSFIRPPFHEAKTHSELSIFIRNGRIPPLPRGYSQALHQVIKSMLNVNASIFFFSYLRQ